MYTKCFFQILPLSYKYISINYILNRQIRLPNVFWLRKNHFRNLFDRNLLKMENKYKKTDLKQLKVSLVGVGLISTIKNLKKYFIILKCTES